MRLHLLGLPHTITHPRFSHCAFTGKALRFSPMLRSVGYEVIHYGVEGAESGANEQVDVVSYRDWQRLGGREPGTKQIGDGVANIGHPLYRAFNAMLVSHLRERFEHGDVVCLPFGPNAYAEALSQLRSLPGFVTLETGIGYPMATEGLRVYESQAWMHWHLGSGKEPGSDYWWVIPNYFDPEEWALGDGSGGYVVYFGRLNADKGLDTIWEVAKRRPDLEFVICGQGDATPWLTPPHRLPNLTYRPPIHGPSRDALLGDAICTMMPTRYVEPFGGVTVESHLCGTPVLGSTFGSFTETIEDGENGMRCRTLADWLDGVALAEGGAFAPRAAIRERAIEKYSMWHLAHEYDRVFRQIADLKGAGWYTERPRVDVAMEAA